MNIEDFLKMQSEDKANWINEFLVTKLQRSVTYTNIKDKQWKTQYLSIEAPKNEPTQAEKDKSAVILRELAKKAEVNKLARFIEKRNTILERLRLEEVRLWEMTTVDKIECYNKYKLTK